MTLMKKGVLVIFVLAIFVILYTRIRLPGNKPDLPQEQEYGSFTPYDVESFDGKYIAKQKAEKPEGLDWKDIRIYVYDQESGELVDRFYVARAWDFWGICWEKDSYNIWTQSADIGTYCYRYEDGTWVRDEQAERPEYIVSRWEAKEAAKE